MLTPCTHFRKKIVGSKIWKTHSFCYGMTQIYLRIYSHACDIVWLTQIVLALKIWASISVSSEVCSDLVDRAWVLSISLDRSEPGQAAAEPDRNI